MAKKKVKELATAQTMTAVLSKKLMDDCKWQWQSIGEDTLKVITKPNPEHIKTSALQVVAMLKCFARPKDRDKVIRMAKKVLAVLEG